MRSTEQSVVACPNDCTVYCCDVSACAQKCVHVERRIDRQTDMTKLTVAFRKFAKAPKTIKLKLDWKLITVFF